MPVAHTFLRESSACGPWSLSLGLTRSLLASTTLLTLVANDPDALFRPLGAQPSRAVESPLLDANLFTLLEPSTARWIAVALLAVVASGWRPRITGLVHWWISFSFANAAVVLDGGDQVSSVVTLLLLPVTLLDTRRSHWEPAVCAAIESVRTFVVRSALIACKLQVAVIYFTAAIGKFAVREWTNGTAVYYWFTHPTFGADGWRDALMRPIITSAGGVVALTWGTLALELLLGAALFGSPRVRQWLFMVGVLFHGGIILVHGLVSFGIVMMAALILYLLAPVGCPHEQRHAATADVPQPEVTPQTLSIAPDTVAAR